MTGTAIVTGGTGGLGGATVARLRADGWRVVVPWIAEAELERLPAGDEDIVAIRADLTEPEEARRVAEAGSGDAAAPLRALVNLVGGYESAGRVHETPVERFEAQLRLNLRPTYLMTQAVLLELMDQGGGSIVCVGSRAAQAPFPGAAGYVTAKAGVAAFVTAVAREYRDDGIRCNAIIPSTIDTPANRAAMPKADHARWVAPAAIAGVIAHLLSDASAPTSGALIPVFGRA